MADQFIGQILADKYRIDSVLRESELGTIYHGTHLLMDKPVAVKILSPELAADEDLAGRFSAEARSLSHISHPNILNVTDFGTDADGTVYIVFEDAEGETLEEVIRREGMFPAERAVNVARQIAAALAAAHSRGIVHGSLNGENILLLDGEIVKLLDLGSVRPEAEDTAEGEVFFSDPAYLAPEQFSEPGSSGDERVDIYALGVIFYEMLAGEVPYRAANPNDLMIKHAQAPPAPLSAYRHDLPADIELIILRALAKNPEMRYQTADDFNNDLSRISLTISQNDGAAAARTPQEEGSNIWKTAFVVLAGISILAIGLIYATSVRQTDPATTLQTDANGQPVQPINPASGINERGLANIVPLQSSLSNSNTMVAPETLTGSDANPYWQSGTVPPGAPPVYLPPGGEVITIGNSNSQFMPPDGVILVPVPVNANVSAQPSPTPRTTRTPANANTQPPADADDTKPQATPDAKPTPAPAKTAAPSPRSTEKPRPTQPSSTESTQSGKPQDTD